MARPREFNRDEALGHAMGVFWSKGYAGASTSDLLEAMQIGRQSMYDAFGDKRSLYLEALEHYQHGSVQGHLTRLRSKRSALAGIEALLLGLIADDDAELRRGCMGVAAIAEFGSGDARINKLRVNSGKVLAQVLKDCVEQAQRDSEIPADIDSAQAVHFIQTVMQGLQTGARAGTDPRTLRATAKFALSALARS